MMRVGFEAMRQVWFCDVGTVISRKGVEVVE